MYWLASAATCSSSSSLLSPAGNRMLRVITAVPGRAMATWLVLVPLRRTKRRSACATWSKSLIWPSVTQPGCSSSMPTCQTRKGPDRLLANSTSLTLEARMSSPIKGTGSRLNKNPGNRTTTP